MNNTIEHRGSRYVQIADAMDLRDGDVCKFGSGYISRITTIRHLFVNSGYEGRYYRMVEDYPDKEEKS